MYLTGLYILVLLIAGLFAKDELINALEILDMRAGTHIGVLWIFIGLFLALVIDWIFKE